MKSMNKKMKSLGKDPKAGEKHKKAQKAQKAQ